MSNNMYQIQTTGIDTRLSGWRLGSMSPVMKKRSTFFPGKSSCAICQKAIPDREWRLFRTCATWKCRLEYRTRSRAIDKRRKSIKHRHRIRFDTRLSLLRTIAADLAGLEKPDEYKAVVIPASRNIATKCSNERHEILKRHLGKLIAEVKKKGEKRDDDQQTKNIKRFKKDVRNITTHPVIKKACALCQGRCCINGKDHGYLSANTIFRNSKKDLSAPYVSIVQRWLSHKRDITIENSCIFHGVNGCFLPRSIRSHTCNDFECNPLKQLMATFGTDRQNRFFMVAADKGRVIRYAFYKIG